MMPSACRLDTPGLRLWQLQLDISQNTPIEGQGYSSVAECLPNTHETLSLIPSTGIKKQNKTHTH
jgi:hypothetical protein